MTSALKYDQPDAEDFFSRLGGSLISEPLAQAVMALLGTTVIPVASGSRTLKDAMNDAIRDWVTNVDDTGSVAGMHPYPTIVHDFQTVIGRECLTQMPALFKRLGLAKQLPDTVIACVSGAS